MDKDSMVVQKRNLAYWEIQGGLAVDLKEKSEKGNIPGKEESKYEEDSREKRQVAPSGRSIGSKRQQRGGCRDG